MEINFSEVSRSLANRLAQSILETESYRNLAEQYAQSSAQHEEKVRELEEELDALKDTDDKDKEDESITND